MSEIIEGNKAIAIFMGYKLVEFHSPFLGLGWRNENIKNQLYGLLEGNEERQIYFNTQWDWLMPVVEKIRATVDEEGYNQESAIESQLQIFGCTIFSPIKTVWWCVIQFIEWYNQQPVKQ